jgi:hypothetical protein
MKRRKDVTDCLWLMRYFDALETVFFDVDPFSVTWKQLDTWLNGPFSWRTVGFYEHVWNDGRQPLTRIYLQSAINDCSVVSIAGCVC